MNRQLEKISIAKSVPASIAAHFPAISSVLNFRPIRKSRFWHQSVIAAVLILPLLAAFFYVKILAVPMYTSEVRFFVGGASDGGGGGASRMLPGSFGGSGSALLDGFAVRDYLSSHDAMERLDRQVGYFKDMQNARKDPLYHIEEGATLEQKLEFYRTMVQPRFNLSEGIVSVVVHAFSPEQAYRTAAELQKMAEAFSNEMNQRVLVGSIEVAQGELDRAQKGLSEARNAFDRWRRENAELDPEANAKMIGELIATLEQKYVDVRSALVEMEQSAERSPQRNALATKLAVIREQIEHERRRLTATDQDQSVVNKLLEFQKLKLQQEFAAKGYEKALEAMQATRAAVGLKQKYVLTIVAPTHPQEASYPRLYRTLGLVLLLSILSYFLGSLVFSVIRDSHRH